MLRTFALPLILTVASVAGSCAPQRSAHEETLRQALILLRAEVSQFTLAHHRTPGSIAELISSTYIKQLPTDPFTGRNDTWREHLYRRRGTIHSACVNWNALFPHLNDPPRCKNIFGWVSLHKHQVCPEPLPYQAAIIQMKHLSRNGCRRS